MNVPGGGALGDEFSNMLMTAVKMKSAQMETLRRKYETWPPFFQHTLFHGEKGESKDLRMLPYKERLVAAEKWKTEGNELFKKGDYDKANDKYEHACGLFYYCFTLDPDWRKKGIDDDKIDVCMFKGTPEEEEGATKFRIQCILNIAQCQLKLSNYTECIRACDEVLELDAKNVKALYRRAMARVAPTGHGGYELDQAITDLSLASALSPDDVTIRGKLTALKKDKQKQKVSDTKTYSGLFDRGTIYKGVESDLQACTERLASESKDDDPPEKRIADAEMLRDLYMKNGKTEEAKKIDGEIKKAKKAMRAPPPKAPDFSNPTPEMFEDAKKFGLDLTDPIILAELQRLSSEKAAEKDGGKKPSVDGPPPDMQDMKIPRKPTEVLWMRVFIFFAIFGTLWHLLSLSWMLGAAESTRRGSIWLGQASVGLVGRAISSIGNVGAASAVTDEDADQWL